MKPSTRIIFSAVLAAAVHHATVHAQTGSGDLPGSVAPSASSNQLPAVSFDQLSTEPQDLSTLGQRNTAPAAVPAAVAPAAANIEDAADESSAAAAAAAALPTPTANLSANSVLSSVNAMPTAASDTKACSMSRESQAYLCYMNGRSAGDVCAQYEAQMKCLDKCPAGSAWEPVMKKLEEYNKKHCDPSASASDDDDKGSSTMSKSSRATKTATGADATGTGDDNGVGHLVVGSWSLVVGSAMAYFLV
ncbi:hypothetical protein H4R34_003462 [Dimargaris verticillata]|uniref:Uncharacterized protein n=1 Tax=Dimargaris verticillata TaxID=2761393 RepID=A0A9W8B6U9_9FUNG|nr:hypothetical protein H4R34_003462 [Dimargaris verticillata]